MVLDAALRLGADAVSFAMGTNGADEAANALQSLAVENTLKHFTLLSHAQGARAHTHTHSLTHTHTHTYRASPEMDPRGEGPALFLFQTQNGNIENLTM